MVAGSSPAAGASSPRWAGRGRFLHVGRLSFLAPLTWPSISVVFGAACPTSCTVTLGAWPDLVALFEQGGDPRRRGCAWYRVRAKEISLPGVAEHRERLRALASQDRPPGLLADVGDEAVGWVSFGPRSSFERLTHSKVLAPLDDGPVWSIVCFVVARRLRGRGIAPALLRAAVEFARARGAPALEVYPADASHGRIPAASAYTGTLSMFEAAGFSVAGHSRPIGGAKPRPIVCLDLEAGS
ncbi:MAG: hypothetical protein KatS3mg065_0728 [Chloroflexota bacterium]|nr:MAG: hypothetical protein KatS3mg065_0728 [Chloroflexota bacterium]